MAEATIFEEAQTHVTSDGDSGWISTADATTMDLECKVTATTTNSVGAVALLLTVEGQEADNDVTTLWEVVCDGPGWQYNESFGPGTNHDVILPPKVRFRWAMGGGTATFDVSLTSR